MKNFNAQYGKHSRLELLKHFILEHGTYIVNFKYLDLNAGLGVFF